MMKRLNGALYISYNGALEDIVPTQVIPYLRELAGDGYRFTLLTFEKRHDLDRAGAVGVAELKNRLSGMGIEWHWLRYHKRFPLLATSFDVAAGIICGSYLALRGRARVIHSRSIVPAAMGLVISKALGCKHIFDTRGLLADEYAGCGYWSEGGINYRVVKYIEKLCLKASDFIVVLTKKHYEYLSALPFLKKKAFDGHIVIIPCCVDLSRFRCNRLECDRARRENGLGDSFIFMYLGKMGRYYMLEEMLDFLKIAFGNIPDSKFIIVSQHDKKEILNALSGRNITMDRIVVVRPSFEDIPALLSMANAGIFFIRPYRKFGSSPIKLGEFLSCGVPVIINSGVGDTAELVSSNRIGVVVDKFEEAEYSRALKELSGLLDEGDALRKRCRKSAEEYLALEIGVKKYASIYKSLCD